VFVTRKKSRNSRRGVKTFPMGKEKISEPLGRHGIVLKSLGYLVLRTKKFTLFLQEGLYQVWKRCLKGGSTFDSMGIQMGQNSEKKRVGGRKRCKVGSLYSTRRVRCSIEIP